MSTLMIVWISISAIICVVIIYWIMSKIGLALYYKKHKVLLTAHDHMWQILPFWLILHKLTFIITIISFVFGKLVTQPITYTLKKIDRLCFKLVQHPGVIYENRVYKPYDVAYIILHPTTNKLNSEIKMKNSKNEIFSLTVDNFNEKCILSEEEAKWESIK